MNTTTLDFLFRVDAPWIYVGPGEVERTKWNPVHFYSRFGLNVCVRRLRGQKMRTTEALMNEFGAALQLFDGFGENWYALEECLGYLDEWLPADAYVLIVEQAEELLRDEKLDQMESFLKTLEAAGEYWSKPVLDNDRFDRAAIPFHVLLHVSNDAVGFISRIVKTALDAAITLRN